MLSNLHCGLYFTPQHIRQATRARKREPLAGAWQLLSTREKPDWLGSTLWNGFRYRFEGDADAGGKAAENLLSLAEHLPDAPASPFARAQNTAALAQCIELVRDHPALAERRGVVLDHFAAQLAALNQLDGLNYTAEVWRGLANVAGGVVLESPDQFEMGAHIYRLVVDHDIHPDGYIPQVVEQADGFASFVLVVQGLVLMAEAAKHAGVDLWGYNNRGVSVVTAALYPLYYYYYPEKWQWSAELLADETQGVIRRHGTFLEMLNHHIGRPTHAIDLIVNEIRPISDVYGGGIATLTHSVTRRGLFG